MHSCSLVLASCVSPPTPPPPLVILSYSHALILLCSHSFSPLLPPSLVLIFSFSPLLPPLSRHPLFPSPLSSPSSSLSLPFHISLPLSFFFSVFFPPRSLSVALSPRGGWTRSCCSSPSRCCCWRRRSGPPPRRAHPRMKIKMLSSRALGFESRGASHSFRHRKAGQHPQRPTAWMLEHPTAWMLEAVGHPQRARRLQPERLAAPRRLRSISGPVWCAPPSAAARPLPVESHPRTRARCYFRPIEDERRF